MSRKKRWAAKARRLEHKSLNVSLCPQCMQLQAMRETEFDGPCAATRGRCVVCGHQSTQSDVARLLRVALKHRMDFPTYYY